MPYFGEVREFATGAYAVPQPPYLVSERDTWPWTFMKEDRLWTGSEWAALGSDACNKALAAIRDDTHDPLAQPGALR